MPRGTAWGWSGKGQGLALEMKHVQTGERTQGAGEEEESWPPSCMALGEILLLVCDVGGEKQEQWVRSEGARFALVAGGIELGAGCLAVKP